MIVRMSLIHAIEGAIVISEMAGWGAAKSRLERHPQFNSIVEYYDSDLLAYGSNGVENGGIDFLKNIERKYGPDATVTQLIEENESGRPEDFKFVYSSQINIISFVESITAEAHDLKLLILPNDLWAKLVAHFDSPVDLKSTTDLYGNAIDALPSVDVNLSSQTIRQLAIFNQLLAYDYGLQYDISETSPDFFKEIPKDHFISIELQDVTLDEVTTHFNLDRSETVDIPNANYVFQYPGTYTIDLKLNFAEKHFNDSLPGAPYGFLNLGGRLLEVYVEFNGEAPILVPYTNVGTDPTIVAGLHNDYTEYSYTITRDFKALDSFKVYAKAINFDFGFGNNTVTVLFEQLVLLGIDNSGIGWSFDTAALAAVGVLAPNDLDTHFYITAYTKFDPTICPGFFIHDVYGGIIDRVTGKKGSFHSPFLGGVNTLYKIYPEDGKACNYVNFRGLQLRGYTLAEKPFAQSLKDQWDGTNPILNKGMGYDLINGQEKIVIGPIEDFFDDSEISIYLSNVKNISRSYDESVLVNQFECGYQKWQENNTSKIDDSQTQGIRTNIFKTVGQKFSQLSKQIAASLWIEVMRRFSKTPAGQSTAYSTDNETIIISTITDGDGTRPELDEVFSSVTNLLNEETRYNKRITSARNFLRWNDWISSGLQSNLSSVWKFVSGQGNYDMSAVMTFNNEAESFSGSALSEKQDIPVSSNPLFLPMLYSIQHVLTKEQYETLQQKRHKAIGVSQSTADYTKFFIKTLQFERETGLVSIVAWPKTFMDLKVINNDTPENNYIFGDEFAHPPFS